MKALERECAGSCLFHPVARSLPLCSIISLLPKWEQLLEKKIYIDDENDDDGGDDDNDNGDDDDIVDYVEDDDDSDAIDDEVVMMMVVVVVKMMILLIMMRISDPFAHAAVLTTKQMHVKMKMQTAKC